MVRKLKDVEITLGEIKWADARFSHPRMTELCRGLAESGVKLILIERNHHPYIICGKYIVSGNIHKWVSADFCLINSDAECDIYNIESNDTKMIGWAEMPEPTYYTNNQKR